MIEPFLTQFADNEWEFVYPPDIDNEKVYEEFGQAVELLDDDDHSVEIILKNLISKHPYYIDAYNHLSIAFKNLNKRFESYLTAEKAYNLGKKLIPKKFNIGKDKLPWSMMENRPFLRACHTFGLECQYKKDYVKAIELYSEILSYNSNDNQGVRYLIIECLLAQKKFSEAKNFLDKLTDDWFIDSLYGKVVVEIMLNNETKAREFVIDAIRFNKFVPDEIIKDRHKTPPPFRLPGEPYLDAGNPVGSIQEAYEYWQRNKEVYKIYKVKDFFKTVIN